jgi:hypothetical protein
MNGISAWLAIAPVATAAAAFPEPKMPTYLGSPMNFWTFWTACDGFDALSRMSTTTRLPLMPPREFQYATTASTACRSLWPTSCVGPVSGASMPK